MGHKHVAELPMQHHLREPLQTLVDENPPVSGAILADLDGSDLAYYPEPMKEALGHSAVFAGVALKRSSVAEKRAGRAPITEMCVDGERGAFIAVMVGDEHLILAAMWDHTPAARITEATRRVAERMADLLKLTAKPVEPGLAIDEMNPN
ncbi:MAG: hypothetical protein VX589_01975 [Myxococcota bacterium]|nr:hypothetical protein [Myxococcota bacterium]